MPRARAHATRISYLLGMGDDHESWTDEDDAALIVEGLPDWHPSLFVHQFRDALQIEPPVPSRLLSEGFVTPESIKAWGD